MDDRAAETKGEKVMKFTKMHGGVLNLLKSEVGPEKVGQGSRNA